MPIKTNNPTARTAEVFDNIDAYDIRFRKIRDTWKCTVKYVLASDSGEVDAQQVYASDEPVEDIEIKKLYKLIAKITNGTIIGV